MTVTTTDSRDVKQGDGSTTDFSTSFQFFREEELDVTLVLADGTLKDQTLNSDYTVSGGDGSTGTVEMSTAPASDEQLIIARQTFRVQNLDLVANDFLPAEALEDVADRLVLIVQELEDVVQRTPRIRPDFTGASPIISAPNSGKLLTWDANGNLVNTDIGEIDTDKVNVTTFGENLVGQAGPDGARTQLEVDDHTKAGDVDASFLEGNSASYYTDINARLGYTAANKAGETFTNPVAVEGSSGGVFLRARPSTTKASDNQAVQLRHSNSGLATVRADAGSDGLGDLVLQSASIPQHDDGNQLLRFLTTADREGWRFVSGGSIPAGNASFDVALPSGYRRFRFIIFEGELNASEHPRILLSDDGGSTFFTDGSTGNQDYISQFASFQEGSDNHTQNFQGFAPLTHYNKRQGPGDTTTGSTFDSFVDILNAPRSDKNTAIYVQSQYKDKSGEPGHQQGFVLLRQTTNATDVMRVVAGATTSWADGTWELWAVPT